MSTGPVHEFALDGPGSSSEGGGASGSPAGPPPGDRASRSSPRRRSSPGLRRSTWPWVALAMVLVVLGAALSPQGGWWQARPPQPAWTAEVPPGSAPGVWVLGGHPVVSGPDGLRALDPSTGATLWQVPLADPVCTAVEGILACVHGQGEAAQVATIDASGATVQRDVPGADVAARVGTDLVVAGRDHTGHPWLTRVPATGDGPAEWRYLPELPSGRDLPFVAMAVSQGVVTVSTAAARPEDPGDAFLAYAVDAGTGAPRIAALRDQGVLVTVQHGEVDQDDLEVFPLPGVDLHVPGHPGAIAGPGGVFDPVTGDAIWERAGVPLVSLGEDLVMSGTPLRTDRSEPVPPSWLTRVGALAGHPRWRVETEYRLSCPCARTGSNVVLAELAVPSAGMSGLGLDPLGLRGVDVRTGQLRWTLPLDVLPTALAAGTDRVYLLTDGVLTAYADR